MIKIVGIITTLLLAACVGFAIVMRRRDAAARRAWRAYIAEQALLNDAAVAERRKAVNDAVHRTDA